MAGLPDLTILLGPQTRLSLALNAHLRENRQYLQNQSVRALPSRLASPMVRRAANLRPLEERQAEFSAATEAKPTLLSAINLFGPPQAGLVKGELFPNVELTLARLAPIIGGARVVLAIDPLPEFFLAAGSDPLEERVRKTSWDLLFELSWYDLISELVAAMPEALFLVLTGARAGKDLPGLEKILLGDAANGLPQRYTLLRHLISDTGTAVLDRMVSRGTPDIATLQDLYQSFAVTASRADQRDRLGFDKVTGILLAQRFEEDLDRIAQLSRVKVF